MAFPASPTNGQSTTINGVTYIYNTTLGAWTKSGSVADASPVSSVAGRTGAVTLTAADIGAGTFPGALTAASSLAVSGILTATSGTAATSTTTGALVVTGGAGISAALYVGGAATVSGTLNTAAISASGSITTAGTLTAAGLSVTGINSTPIGASSPNTGAFTSLSATGVTTIPYHYVNRSGAAASGISWYSTGYTSWTEYMAAAGSTGCGPTGSLSVPTGTLVTTWGLRSYIENGAGYGWTWESGTSTQTSPTIVAELRSSDGTFRTGGHIYMTGGLGVGTTATTTSGQILATNSITAYYSDERLKTKISTIENALDKIDELTGFLYRENDLAKSYGFKNDNVQVALGAQAVQKVQPEATALAPFDRADDGTSKSGEHYLTVQYERLIPLLVEGIKELRKEINQLKGK